MKPAVALPAALALGVLSGSAPAEAGDAGTRHPAIIEALASHGATVESLASVPGLSGYYVTPAGDSSGYTLYVTAHGHAVMGLLYSPAGVLLTPDRLAAAGMPDEGEARVDAGPPAGEGAHPPVAAAGPTLSNPAGPFGFTLGAAGPALRVFADPDCRWSRLTVAHLAAEALAGEIVLKIVPVALLGEASAHLAMAAVSEETPDAWFSKAAAPRSDEAARRVAANNRIFHALGGTAVPLVAWQGPSGRRIHTGAILSLADLAGEPLP